MRDSPLRAGDLQPLAAARLRWLETLLLTAALPGLRIAFGSGDPFVLRGWFPWLALVPLAIGMQHGLECALASALLLCGGAWVHAVAVGGAVPAPAFGVASCAIAAVAGRARDAHWEKCERLRRRVVQLEQGIAREKASRHVLQLSHERLLERLAGAPHSLDASVAAAVARLSELKSVSELGRALLELLAQQAELQGGAVFALDGSGVLVDAPVAALGRAPESSAGEGGEWCAVASSPLVLRALRTRRLVSVVDGEQVSVAGQAGVLAALPLMAADARVLGIVAMTQLPFAAFHPAALSGAFVLVSGVTSQIDPQRWSLWVAALTAGDAEGGAAVNRKRAAGPRPRARWGMFS
jgi:hypothetical protein